MLKKIKSLDWSHRFSLLLVVLCLTLFTPPVQANETLYNCVRYSAIASAALMSISALVEVFRLRRKFNLKWRQLWLESLYRRR